MLALPEAKTRVAARSSSPHHRRLLRLVVYASLAMGDLIGLALLFFIAGFLIGGGSHREASPALMIIAMFFAIAIQRKPYSSRFLIDAARTVRDRMTALVTATTLAGMMLLRSDEHAWNVGAMLALGLIFASAWLLLWSRIIDRMVLLIFKGQPIATITIVDDIAFIPPPGLPTLYSEIAGLRPDRNDPAALDTLARAIAGMERVAIACTPARRSAWLDVLKGSNVQGEFLLPELDNVGMLRIARLGSSSTAIVSVGPLDTYSRIVKRVLDLSVVLIALAMLWPVLLLTMVAIRIDSPGPALFRQPRVGRGNRLFGVYKFRSMYVAQCDITGAQSTSRTDQRVTRVGRFIRAKSIDELPQLFNVLGGTMSMVGPRPHAIGSKADGRVFWEIEKNYWHRHAMKPGITGLAQVNGLRGATEKVSDLTDRVALDTAYISEWSVWRDIGIILRTAIVVFRQNAY